MNRTIIQNKNVTTDYTTLANKPAIAGVTLTGDKSLADLGIQPAGNYLTEETDPDVYEWAKAETKPTYTASEVGAVAISGDTMTGDLNFTGAGINDVNYIDIDVLATSGAKVGRMRWNATDQCYQYDALSDATTINNNVGQCLYFRVRNNTGVTIDKGKVVYVSGAVGNRPAIALARADNVLTSATTVGITTSAISHGADGYIIVNGDFNDLNTNAYSAGEIIYLSPTTAGGTTNVRPTAPNISFVVGIVTVKSGTGSISVKPVFLPNLVGLSDVYAPSKSNGDFLAWNSTNLRWEVQTFDVAKTYAGFVNRTDSTIGVDASGVVTLAPAVTSYTVYVNGTKKVLTNTQTVTVTSDQTLTYIYLDSSGVLQKDTSAWDFTSNVTIPVAICFKDGNTYALTDERHGHERNKAWHNWAHMNIGTMYKSGLTGTFGTSSLSVVQGVIYDEDLRFDTGGTKTACSLWYRNATSGMRLVRGASACKSVSGGGVLQYDDGSGTLQEVSLNSYTTNWVYCSNDATEPIYTVIGQNNSNTLNLARNTPAPTINLSTAEWKLIYKVIYQHTAGVTAGVFVETTDYRAVQTGVPTASVITDHATLINRDASNSHPSSAISYSATDVQTELDARINKTYTLDILTGDWSTNSFDQTITGLTATDVVIVQATDSYYTDYGLSYTQSTDTITFTVTVTPLITLSLGIAVVKAVSGGAL